MPEHHWGMRTASSLWKACLGSVLVNAVPSIDLAGPASPGRAEQPTRDQRPRQG